MFFGNRLACRAADATATNSCPLDPGTSFPGAYNSINPPKLANSIESVTAGSRNMTSCNPKNKISRLLSHHLCITPECGILIG